MLDDAPFGRHRSRAGDSSTLVQMMGGRIWVESEAGTGSTFHVVVPFQVAEEAAEGGSTSRGPLPVNRSAVARPALAQAMRVLVVEDNIVNPARRGWLLTARSSRDPLEGRREAARAARSGNVRRRADGPSDAGDERHRCDAAIRARERTRAGTGALWP